MENINGSVYHDVVQAYRKLLEQLDRGEIDGNFAQYVNCVYSFARISGEDMRKEMAAEIYSLLRHQENIGLSLSVYSFLLRLDPNVLYLEEFLKKLRSLQKICSLEWQIAGFYYRQLNRVRLQQPECDTGEVRELLSELVMHGVTSCMRHLNVAVCPLPYAKRNEDRVVVLTDEFTKENSIYRKQVLDYCHKLQHIQGRKVFLVNTAEAVSRVGEVSFLNPEYGEWDEELGKRCQVEWKGEMFDFFQCENVFSDMNELENSIKKILEYNPGMVFHIGDGSFFAGIIDEWIPVLSMGKEYGRYTVSATEFQAAFDSVQDAEQEFLNVIKDYEGTIADEKNLKVRLVFPADYFQDELRYAPHEEKGTWEEYTVYPGRKKIWAVELAMLQELSRICEKHDIKFFAHKGTLLGSLRCQGFFPWDDDIDIAMKREDYNKFVKAAPKELAEPYCLMDASIVPQWEEFKIQILCRSDAEMVLGNKKRQVRYFPSIDIAVLDYLPKEPEEIQKQQEILEDIFVLMWRIDYNGKLEGSSIREFEELKKKLGFAINETSSERNQLVQLQQLVAGQNRKDDSAELYQSIDYYYNHERWESFSANWFEDGEMLPFENQMIKRPGMYTKILDALYPDGWQDIIVRRARETIRIQEEDYLNIDKGLYHEDELKRYKENFFEEEKQRIHFVGYSRVENFFIKKKMKCAWAASLKVLKEVERICRKHGLQYFAYWGTLLGAVRDQGYVPWDDDIDIAMKREDYNRFLEIVQRELPGYSVVDEVFDENWETSVSRIINVADANHAYVTPHTEKEEEFFGSPFVIGIDIYQFDYFPRDRGAEKWQNELIGNAIKIKYELRENGNKITKEILDRAKALGKACNYHFTDDRPFLIHILTLIGAISQMYGSDEGEEMANIYDRFKNKRFRFRKEWFEESISLPFETTTVEVPREYMKVLLSVYGRYWERGYTDGSSHDYPFYKKQEKDLEKQGIVLEQG